MEGEVKTGETHPTSPIRYLIGENLSITVIVPTEGNSNFILFFFFFFSFFFYIFLPLHYTLTFLLTRTLNKGKRAAESPHSENHLQLGKYWMKS